MSTYSAGGLAWDWENMTVTNANYVHNLKWNSDECDLYFRLTGGIIWTSVGGHHVAIESYKSYIADQILLGRK